MISIIECIAQAENESRSDNIKWGIKYRAATGTSKLYDRKCYGYEHNAESKLIIDEETAENVRLIYNLYLQGQSVIGIIPSFVNWKNVRLLHLPEKKNGVRELLMLCLVMRSTREMSGF